MEQFLIYIGKASLAAGTFYLLYLALFQHQKHFVFNRIYLPVSLALSFLIPLITFTSVRYIEPNTNTAANSFAYLPEMTEIAKPEFVYQWYHYLFGIYLLGILGFLGNLLVGHLKAISIVRFSQIKKLFNASVNITPKDVHPFSFFNKIVLSENTLDNPNLEIIVKHEKIHVDEKHTLDILFAEILFLLQWFNPFAWLIKDAMRNNLEYKTDHQITQNNNAEAYQLAMVGLAHKEGVAPFLTALNGSQLKNRIIMMKKKTENKYTLLKQLVVLPLLAILVMGLSNKNVEVEILKSTKEVTIVLDGKIIPNNDPALNTIDFSENFDGGEVTKALGVEDEVIFNTLSMDENNENWTYYVRTRDYIPGTNAEFEKMTSSTLEKETTISGKVTNEKGEPIPAASVIIKGTSTGTITDLDGKFEIRSDNKIETLMVAMIGYKTQEIEVDKKSKINVTLQADDSDKKDQIKVVGYGSMNSGFGASNIGTGFSGKDQPMYVVDGVKVAHIHSVQPDDIHSIEILKDQAATNAYGELAKNGVVKITTKEAAKNQQKSSPVKVQFSGDTKNPPLYIVDGIEVAEVESLQPDDIESISVLKDESATSLYGDKGKNGVILITSKDAATVKNKNGVEVIGYGTQIKPTTVDSHVDASKTVFLKSVSGEEQPLYIVDGKEIENLDKLQPDDIESISVLKDASATSLYGEKGANGVVVVTTKDLAKNKMRNAIVIVDGKKYDGDVSDIDPETIEKVDVLKNESAAKRYGPKAKDGAIVITTKHKVDLGDKSPLILIDGVPTEKGVNDIDPETIKSIDVLKDATSIEKYGKSGKDGVILITTKSADITSELELRKFIAKRIKYPLKAQEANKDGIAQLFVKVNADGIIYSVSDKSVEDAVLMEEVVVVAYKPSPQDVIVMNEIEDLSNVFNNEAKRVLNQLPIIEVSEYKGETLAITVKFILQDK